MSKSIYSLVLSDSVVDAVDELAREAGMSRSSMINEILAHHVGCLTPEMRLREVLAAARQAMGGGFYMVEQPTGSTLCCKTALKYRYKPTVRYAVEIFEHSHERAGRFKVQLRTQNPQLIGDFVDFFVGWRGFERAYIVPRFAQDIVYSMDEGKFARELHMPRGGASENELGEAVADYMAMFDSALKAYFAQLPDKNAAISAAAESYSQNIVRQKHVL